MITVRSEEGGAGGGRQVSFLLRIYQRHLWYRPDAPSQDSKLILQGGSSQQHFTGQPPDKWMAPAITGPRTLAPPASCSGGPTEGTRAETTETEEEEACGWGAVS